MPGRGSLRGGGPESARRLRGPPRCDGGPGVGEPLLRSEETKRRNGGALLQHPGGGVGLAEHGMCQGQAREGDPPRAGEVAGLCQSGRLGVIAASGRRPALQGGDPPEVRGEPDLGDGHPPGGDDLGAGLGQPLGLRTRPASVRANT